MQGKITQVTLVVKDQEAALKFYTEKVGFDKITDFNAPGVPRWVTVGPKGGALELALFQLGSRTVGSAPSALRQVGNGMMIIAVDDCQKTFDEMTARGVTFRTEKPMTQPWGTLAEFEDPDGNHFTIRQAPAWPAKT